jgi:hypothetical protein
MGNRVLAPAVANVFNPSAEKSLEKSLLGEVILAAADADVDKMRDWIDAAMAYARRISIYASITDRALQLSRLLHKSERVGGSSSPDARWDTIHCDGCGDDWIRHSYIFETPAVLSDIRAALSDKRCDERNLLPHKGPRAWKLLVK